MGLTVAVAPRPELLLDDLAERLARPLPDPFDEDVVVVPTTGIRNWLRAELAVRLGIVVRVRFVLPGTLPELVLGTRDTDAEWRLERLVWHVLGQVVARPDGVGDPPWSAAPGRAFTIATRVAELLDHYAAQRPGMLAAWARGEDRVGADAGAAALPAAQRWQAEAWRSLVAAVPGPAPSIRVAEAVARVGADPGSGGHVEGLPPRLTVFGPGAVTDHALGLLAAAAEGTDVAVLAVVPRRRSEAPLAAWGARSSEVSAAVEELAASSAIAVRRTPVSATGVRQLDLLRDALAEAIGPDVAWPQPDVPTAERRGDGSVVVHACHGAVRQLEVARDAILHALEADVTLLPRDVLVLCSDIVTMAPLVGPILGAPVAREGADDQRLAVQVVDRSAPADDLVRLVLDRALAAAADRLTREDVEALLAMAPVRATLELDLDDVGVLRGLFDELSLRWGVDAAHRRRFEPDRARDDDTDDASYRDSAGDGTLRDVRDRLAAGLLLHPDPQRVVTAGTGPLAPARIAADSFLPTAGRVAEALDALMRIATAAAAPATVERWAGLTGRMITTLMRPAGRGAEAVAWRGEADRLLDAVEVVVAAAADAGAAEAPLTLREWARALDLQLGTGGGGVVPSAGRVQVGSIAALRGVPARVVVLVGLDDRSVTAADADDVLAGGRRRGERDPAAEARSALLESVVAARDRLVITFDGRSITTGEALPLPTVIEELCDALPDVPDGALPLVVDHPRHLADPRALGLPRGGLAAVPAPSGVGPWTFLPAALRTLRAAGDASTPILGTTAVVVRGAPDGGEVVDPLAGQPGAGGWVDLDLADLIEALRSPARSYLRTRLSIDVPRPEPEVARQLPLVVDGLDRYQLGTELLEAVARGADDVWRRDRPARGGLPPGRLAEDVLDAVEQEVAALLDLVPPTEEVEVRGVELRLAPVGPWSDAHGRGGAAPDRVRLTGALPRQGRRLVDLAFVSAHPREHVRAWLTLLMAAAADPADPWLDEAVVVRRKGRGLDGKPLKGPVRHVLRLRGADAAERGAVALDALARLVDLAALVRDVPIPFSPRASWWVDVPGVARGAVEQALKRDADDSSSLLLLGVPTPDEFAGLSVRTTGGRLTAADVGGILRDAYVASVEVETTLGEAA